MPLRRRQWQAATEDPVVLARALRVRLPVARWPSESTRTCHGNDFKIISLRLRPSLGPCLVSGPLRAEGNFNLKFCLRLCQRCICQ